MTWQAELTINGAVDQTWHDLSDIALFVIYNNLVAESAKEGWRGQFAWWPSSESQGEYADQPGGCHVIAPGMRETA